MTPTVSRNFIIALIVILVIFLAGFYYFYSKLYQNGSWFWETGNSNLSLEEKRVNEMYETLAKLRSMSPVFDEKKIIETLNSLQKTNATSSPSGKSILKKPGN